jgi:hypothetical protein
MADDEALRDGTTRRPPHEIVATRRHAHWVTDVAGHGLTVLTLAGHTAPVFARTALGDGLGLPVYGTVVLAQQHGMLVRRYSIAHGWAADGAIRQAHAATVAAVMSGTLPLDGRHVGPCGEYADDLLAALNSVLARTRAHREGMAAMIVPALALAGEERPWSQKTDREKGLAARIAAQVFPTLGVRPLRPAGSATDRRRLALLLAEHCIPALRVQNVWYVSSHDRAAVTDLARTHALTLEWEGACPPAASVAPADVAALGTDTVLAVIARAIGGMVEGDPETGHIIVDYLGCREEIVPPRALGWEVAICTAFNSLVEGAAQLTRYATRGAGSRSNG